MNYYSPVVIALGTALALANGSNDVSKGIATLVGSGVTDLRRALLWGTVWTGLGALAAAFAARAMIATFGADLFPAHVHPTASAAVAILFGAALWVGLSTWTGLPVATTHAIVGALAGVGAVAYGWAGVRWAALGGKVIVPLLVSPFLAWSITRLLLHHHSTTAGHEADCLCLDFERPVAASDAAGLTTAEFTAIASPALTPCRISGVYGRHDISLSTDGLHWLSCGAVSFSRGLNDAPKMVALLLGAAAVFGGGVEDSFVFFALIAVGIMLGSWLAGRKVTQVLAYDISPMTHREGLIANLVTAALVGPGAALGLPMSTTQVASGAIFGIGDARSLNRGTVRNIAVAWAVTLPGAALLAIAALLLLHALGMK